MIGLYEACLRNQECLRTPGTHRPISWQVFPPRRPMGAQRLAVAGFPPAFTDDSSIDSHFQGLQRRRERAHPSNDFLNVRRASLSWLLWGCELNSGNRAREGFPEKVSTFREYIQRSAVIVTAGMKSDNRLQWQFFAPKRLPSHTENIHMETE